eukprot:9042586-Pyramimonas_sp.AAC.1
MKRVEVMAAKAKQMAKKQANTTKKDLKYRGPPKDEIVKTPSMRNITGTALGDKDVVMLMHSYTGPKSMQLQMDFDKVRPENILLSLLRLVPAP